MDEIKYLLIFCIIYLIFREIHYYTNKNTIEKYTAPPTTPVQNSNLVLWLDANDPYGDGSTPDTASDVVLNTWKDKSGKGNDATASNYPTIVSGGIRVGSGDNFRTNYIFSGNETAFVVVNTLTSGGFQAIRGQSPRLNSRGFYDSNDRGRLFQVMQGWDIYQNKYAGPAYMNLGSHGNPLNQNGINKFVDNQTYLLNSVVSNPDLVNRNGNIVVLSPANANWYINGIIDGFLGMYTLLVDENGNAKYYAGEATDAEVIKNYPTASIMNNTDIIYTPPNGGSFNPRGTFTGDFIIGETSVKGYVLVGGVTVYYAPTPGAQIIHNFMAITDGSTGFGFGGVHIIKEIIIYNSVLSVSDRKKIEGYLAKKWIINLPPGHPHAPPISAATIGTLTSFIVTILPVGFSVTWIGGNNVTSYTYKLISTSGTVTVTPDSSKIILPPSMPTLTTPNTATFTSNISAGMQYTLSVTPYSGTVAGNPQSTTFTTAPGPVSNLLSNNILPNGFTISWTPPSTGSLKYIYKLGDGPNNNSSYILPNPPQGTTAKILSVTNNTATFTGLTANTCYKIRIFVSASVQSPNIDKQLSTTSTTNDPYIIVTTTPSVPLTPGEPMSPVIHDLNPDSTLVIWTSAKKYYAYLTDLNSTSWPQPTPESNSTIWIWNSYDGDGVTTDQMLTHDLISANGLPSNTAPVYAQANGALVGSDTTTIEEKIPYFNTSMNSNKYYFTGVETMIMIVTLNSNNAGLVYSENSNRIIEIKNGYLHIYWASTNNSNTPFSVTGTVEFLPNKTYIISTNINNNTGQIYTFVNGLADINTNYTSQIPMDPILNRSKTTCYGLGAKMWINEILVYSSILSATLRQNYEGFLAKKWNLYLSSKTHPFYVESPNLPPVPLLSPGPTISSTGPTLSTNSPGPTSAPINSSGSTPITKNLTPTLSPVSISPETNTPSLINGLTNNQLYIIIGVVIGGIILLYFMTGSSNNEEDYRPRSRSRSRSRNRD
jgi:hypothetical protein